MGKLNLGVIGAGYWGKKIIQEYTLLAKQDPYVGLLGACDILEGNLECCRKNFGVPCVTQRYEELISLPEVGAVHICTPNETHYQICRDALEAGKHVLLEKPMTLDSREAYELQRLAEKKDLILSVGHIFRFSNALKKTRSLIEEGSLGEIFYLRLQWTAHMPPFYDRDIITDLAPHPFDILNFLLDRWPAKITCKARSCRPETREEVAYITSEFDNDLLGQMELSWLAPEKIREVTVVGSEKVVRVDCLSQEVVVSQGGMSCSLDVERNNTIAAELQHFIGRIQNNDAEDEAANRCSGTVGAHVVRLLEASRRSLEADRTIRVKIGS